MIGIEQIRAILPHRYPMLLVDRVLQAEPGQRLTAVKAVTANEPWYADGTTTAYPPVLLVESWCQAAGLLAAWDRHNPDVIAGQVMLFGAITRIRFHGAVLPGDLVEHRVRLARLLSDSAVFEGEAVVGERTVLTVERVVMAWRPASELQPEHATEDESRRVHV